MIAATANRRELTRVLCAVGLVVAAYASVYLLLLYRSTRVVETQCTLITDGKGRCALQHLVGGREVSTGMWRCGEAPWSDRARDVGMKLPCFYYAHEDPPGYNPRAARPVHRWPEPWPLGLAIGGVVLAAAPLLRRRRSSSETPIEEHPYRTVDEPTPRDASPLHLTATAHWGRWIVCGPFLVLGAALIVLSLVSQWESGNGMHPIHVMGAIMGHASFLVGLLGGMLRSGIDVIPSEGVLVRWRALGPLRVRRFYDLGTIEGTRVVTEGVRYRSEVLQILRRAPLSPVKWDSGEAMKHAVALEEKLREMREPPH
jgi:hypothetical protein